MTVFILLSRVARTGRNKGTRDLGQMSALGQNLYWDNEPLFRAVKKALSPPIPRVLVRSPCARAPG